MTVLHHAVLMEKTDIVKWLVETYGKTLNALKNNYGQLALHFAAAKGIHMIDLI